MSRKNESSASSDGEGLSDIENVNGNEAVDVNSSDTEDAAYSDKQLLDNSSDECSKKRDKKSGQKSKSKVKIKTLTIDGQLVYFCKICDKVFTRRKDKLNHELAHSGESVLSCTECGKEYLHESSLASHMRTHSGDALFLCDLCPKMFAQSHHLKAHIVSHSEPTTFVCKTCYKEFSTSSDLNHHNRIQSKLEIAHYWCKMCKVYFCRSHKLTCDTQLHAFCCSACSELFYTHKKLKIHMKKFAHYSLDKPKYIEPLKEHELYPDKVPENLKKMQAQKESEVSRKPAKNEAKRNGQSDVYSDVPFKKFKLSVRKLIIDEDQSSTSLQDSATEPCKGLTVELKSPTRHRKGKPYCKRCNKSFKDVTDLDRHKALVHEDKPSSFKCEICSLGFASKDELDKHSFKHSGQQIHTCPVCGQECPDSSQLTQHLRIHVGEFPYQCTQCAKAFRLKIQLIQHVRLHITQDGGITDKCPNPVNVGDERTEQSQIDSENFKCHLCSKRFFFRYKLLNHLRLHTNVKCFQCYVCHRMFATKSYLQRHLETHVKQGMDVDVHNIVVDGESKPDFDSIMIDHNEKNEDSQYSHVIKGAKREDVKRPFFNSKRSVSNFEFDSRLKDNCNTSMNTDANDIQGHSQEIRSGDIKAEVEDDIDSFSEHSFCSSFTRDSERSDPFKFSSDESYTFKTVMAKERRRLRRRWKKNRDHFVKSDFRDLSELKNDLNSNFAGTEAGGDSENEITDMMVDLNAVRSECDDVTTVFVSLTEKKMTGCKKTPPSSVAKLSSVTESSDFPKTEFSLKKELEQDNIDNEFRATESNCQEIVNERNQNGDAAKYGSKILLFEFDAECLQDDNKKDNNKDTHMTFTKHSGEKNDLEEETSVITIKTEQVQRAESKSSLSQSLLTSQQKSLLKYIITDTSLTSDTSNLEKLQAIFQHSSKYLPLPDTSPSSKVSSPALQTEPHTSTKDKLSAFGDLIHSHIMNSSTSNLQDKQQIGMTSDDKQATLPLQNNTLIDKMPHPITAQITNSYLGIKPESPYNMKLVEESSNFTLAISETSSGEHSEMSSERTPQENSARNCGTGFTNRPGAINNNVNSSSLMMSQTVNMDTIANDTPLNSNSGTFMVTTYPSHVTTSSELMAQSSSHISFNVTQQPSDHINSLVTSKPSGDIGSNVTSQSLSHIGLNVTCRPSIHNVHQVKSATQTISSGTGQSSGQGMPSLIVRPSDPINDTSLVVRPSNHIGDTSLMVRPSDPTNDSGLMVRPSDHINDTSLMVRPSDPVTTTSFMVQAVHSDSVITVQPYNCNSFTPFVQLKHGKSTPVLQSEHTTSTWSIQSGHSSPAQPTQSLSSTLSPACKISAISTNNNSSCQIVHASSRKKSNVSTNVPSPRSSASQIVSHNQSNVSPSTSSHKSIATSQIVSHNQSNVSPSTSSHKSIATSQIVSHSQSNVSPSTSSHKSTTTSQIVSHSQSNVSPSTSSHKSTTTSQIVSHNQSNVTASTSSHQRTATSQILRHSQSNVSASTSSHKSTATSQIVSHNQSNVSASTSGHKSTLSNTNSIHMIQQTAHKSQCPPAASSTSLGNPLYCNPAIGTCSSEIGPYQASVSANSLSAVNMKTNPQTASVGTQDISSGHVTVNSSFITNQNHPPGVLSDCFIPANSLVNTSCAIGVNPPAPSSFSLAVNSDCFSLNPSTIFDTSNPVYRDMNMMDLISTSSSVTPQQVTLNSLGFMGQGSLETQMRHAHSVGVQNSILQSQNPFINIGNPTYDASFGISGNPAFDASFGMSGNPVSSLLHPQIVPMGYGPLPGQVLATVGVGGGDGTFVNTGNIYGTLPRDGIRLSNCNIPQLPVQLGHMGGPQPMDVANILSINSSGLGDFNSLRAGNFSGPFSMNIADLGGSSIISTGSMPFNQASFHSDFPLSISTNAQMIGNLGGVTMFPTSGLPNNFTSLVASSNINLLNSALMPQNSGILPASSTSFMNDFSASFYPNI